MKRLGLVIGCLISALIVSAVTDTAQATSAEGFGASVLDCFHPNAKFVSVTYTRGHGHHSWMGWIRFREVSAKNHEVVMSFSVDSKIQNGSSLYRIVPLSDDASLPPVSECGLREWQENTWW